MVPPITLAPVSLVTGMDSPVTIDSSTALRPSSTAPSTGTFSPGRTRRRSPTCTWSSSISSSVPSGLMRRAVFGRKIEQCADRAARGLAGAQFEHLAEQNQHGNDGGGLEIDGDGAGRDRGMPPGRPGRERRDHAVDPCDANAHRDQREHVQVAADDQGFQPRTKNGQPAHSTTGVARSTGSI